MPVVNYDWDELEDNIVEEYDDAGATIADYTTEPDHFGNVISQHREGQSGFFQYDGQGSTLVLTDDSQNVTDTRAYSAFGETTESNGSTTFPVQYVGEKGYYRHGLTGQYLVRRRALEPTIARWLAVDVLDIFVSGSGVYNYVNNSPAVRIDPSGLLAEPDVGWKRKLDWGQDFSMANRRPMTLVLSTCYHLFPKASNRCGRLYDAPAIG